MKTPEKIYAVDAVEQRGASRWSTHSSRDAAIKAAKAYRRRNPNTDYWIDQYGYRVIDLRSGRTVETVE